MTIRLKILIAILFLIPLAIYLSPTHQSCVPTQREIAITIDDLPIDNQYFEKISQTLLAHKAPAIGFVIAQRVNTENLNDLEQFRQNGFLIGSHSYSHLKLRKISAEDYIHDLTLADEILTPIMTTPKYFRYPYLSQGRWGKKHQVHDYLAKNHYVIAPVTVDAKDCRFNLDLVTQQKTNDVKYMSDLKHRYLDYVWKQTVKAEQNNRCNATKQILLIHANRLNSYFLNDLLTMYEKKGYRFINLNDALS